jgi:hypothetical protein
MSQGATMRCDRCGKEFPLTAEYLSQHAGQIAQCDCGCEMVVPPAAAHPPARPAESIAGWCDGGYVVAQKGMKLPRRCFKCNAIVKTQMKSIVREWTPGPKNELGSLFAGWLRGILFPLDLFGFINGAIANAETETIVIRFGRCPAHQNRLNKWWLAGAFAAAAIGCLIPMIARSVHGNAAWIVVFGGFMFSIVGMVIALKMGPPFRIVHFDKKFACIDGFGKAYIQSLAPLSSMTLFDGDPIRDR